MFELELGIEIMSMNMWNEWMEVSEFMEIHEFSFADRKLQSGPIANKINIQHTLIPTQDLKETINLVSTKINGKNSPSRSFNNGAQPA